MERDEIVPRTIPNQNIIGKLRGRELNLSRRATPSYYSSDFHKCIHPNLSVISVGRPRSYLRKFSPDGKYFIGFSIDHNYLEIYRYNGPCAASKCLADLQTPVNGDQEEYVVVSNLNGRWKFFEYFFTLKHRVPIGEADYQVNRECCLFSTDNRFVIVASSAVISDDRVPVLYESRRSNESPTLRVPLENILVEMVELDTGIITDRQRFDADKIVLSHNAGFHLYEDTFAVMSVQQQIVHIFRISGDGMFLPVRKIGRFCFDDDELIIGETIAVCYKAQSDDVSCFSFS
jgi:de-etiolated-1